MKLAQKSLKLAHFCDLHRKSHMLKLILSKLYAEKAQQYLGHCLTPGLLTAFFIAGGENRLAILYGTVGSRLY